MAIHSISLDSESEKIFKKINKLRSYGWLSNDIQKFLKTKYGTDEKILKELLFELQKKRDSIEDQIREIAKKLNKDGRRN